MKLVSFQSDEEAQVQMASIIDCVFILLIFFLVTSMLSKPHNELAVKVPDSGASQVATDEKEPVVIVVTSRNPDATAPNKNDPRWEPFIVIGDEIMTKELLERRLRQIAQETPNRRVRLDSDGSLKWRHLVPIVDLCRFHGLARVDVRVN